MDALVKDQRPQQYTWIGLSTIDITSSGYTNSWQPQISYNDGNAPKNTTYWMEFTISFGQVVLIMQFSITVAAFNVTSLDMDGDNDRLREQVSFYGLSSYTLETPTSITVANVTGGKTFTGSYDDYVNVNTSATNIMVTSKYLNTSSFIVRLGAVTGNKTRLVGAERMSSLWFKIIYLFKSKFYTLPVERSKLFQSKKR